MSSRQNSRETRRTSSPAEQLPRCRRFEQVKSKTPSIMLMLFAVSLPLHGTSVNADEINGDHIKVTPTRPDQLFVAPSSIPWIVGAASKVSQPVTILERLSFETDASVGSTSGSIIVTGFEKQSSKGDTPQGPTIELSMLPTETTLAVDEHNETGRVAVDNLMWWGTGQSVSSTQSTQPAVHHRRAESADALKLIWWTAENRGRDVYAFQQNGGEASIKDQTQQSINNSLVCDEKYEESFLKTNTISASLAVAPDLEGKIYGEPAGLNDCGKHYYGTPPVEDRTGGNWQNRTPLGMQYTFLHKPLYFEDANLERCGYSLGCCQPFVSAAHFFGTIPLLPYKMTVDCPHECVESLGRCPEGCRYSCRENYLPPWNAHAALVEGAAVTGLIFLVP